MLNVIINGINSAAEPEGTTELIQRRYFSDELAGYLDEINGDLIIYGQGAIELRRMAVSGLCGYVQITIQDGCGLDLLGNIYLNDAEWDLNNCSVKVQVVDAGFLSLIDNNMAIKAYLNVPISKNGVDISARTNVTTDITLQNPAETLFEYNRKGVSFYDALNFLIAFATDNQLGFVSDFFSSGEDAAVYSYLMTPIALRDNVPDAYPLISFGDLYTDLNRVFNIAFNIEWVSGAPVMRIEPKDYFRTGGNSYTFDSVMDVMQQADRSKFYATVKFGSSSFVPFGPVQGDTYPFAPFYNQKEEEYFVTGTCNTKAILDLQLKTLVTDTTLIYECFPASLGGLDSTDYEDEVLVVQCYNNNYVSWQEPIPNLPDVVVLLNLGFVQRYIAERYIGYITGGIYSWLGPAQDDALAYSTSTQTITPTATEPIVFANDTTFPAYDPNNLMTQGVFSGFPATWYTVPSVGVYAIDVRIIFNSFYLGAINVAIVRRDSGSVIVENQLFTNLQPNIFEVYFNMICDVGDTIMIFAQMYDGEIFTGSTFGVRSLYNQYYSGGEWKEYSIEDMDIMLTQFKYPLPFNDWKQLTNNFNKLATVTYQGGQQQGYPKDVSRNIVTGMTDVTLMGRLLN